MGEGGGRKGKEGEGRGRRGEELEGEEEGRGRGGEEGGEEVEHRELKHSQKQEGEGRGGRTRSCTSALLDSTLSAFTCSERVFSGAGT